jgi:hypothetical protein
VLRAKAAFEPRGGERLRVDAMSSLHANIKSVVAYIAAQ